MVILIIGLFCLFVLSYHLNLKEICAPSFVFSASFMFCGLWALVYQSRWGTILSPVTIGVILGGMVVYISATMIVKTIVTRGKFSRKVIDRSQAIYIQSWKINGFLVFNIASIIIYMYSLRKVTGISSIPEAIVAFRQDAVYGTGLYRMSRIPYLMRIVSTAGGYWFAYVIAQNLIAKKSDIRVFFILALSILCDLLGGGRTAAFNQILAVLSIFLVLKLRQQGKRRILNNKQLLLSAIITIIILITFQQFGAILGREAKRSTFDYLAAYCGASFHNLNTFLTTRFNKIHQDVPGSQTFRNIIRIVLKVMGYRDFNFYFDLPYYEANGYFMGNVCTTFYSFLYDFGLPGCFVLTAFMGAFSELFYQIAKHVKRSFYCPISIIFFGYFFNAIVFSYFSDWFYEEVFNLVLVYYVIIWIFFNFFFCGCFFSKRIVVSSSKIEERL